jgi:thiol-disulfide isomerase/thioredoxin/outer membrane murein-binding lipoprotein Lpp
MKFKSLILATLLTGCATADEVKSLTEKVDALEKKVETLEKSPAKAAPSAAAPTLNDADETKARELLSQITNLMKENKMDEAKAKFKELDSKYGETKTGRRAKRIGAELEIIGKDAPKEFKAEKWLIDGGQSALSDSKPTLVVFWEVWCPHCKREVPSLQAKHDKYKDKLNIVGLTKLTRNKTEDEVMAFLKDNKVTYPVAKETGEMSQQFNVSGIPAAAVVKDGKIIWRGHPARLSDAMLEGWM